MTHTVTGLGGFAAGMAARAPPLRLRRNLLSTDWQMGGVIMSPYRYNLGSQERKTYAKTSKYSKRMWKLREEPNCT